MFWIVLRWQDIKQSITLKSSSARGYFNQFTNFQPLSRYSLLIAYVDTTVLHHFYSRSSFTQVEDEFSAQVEHELKRIAEEELSGLPLVNALTHLAHEHFIAEGKEPSQRQLRVKMDEYEKKIDAIRYS